MFGTETGLAFSYFIHMNIEHILHWFIAVAATAAVVILFSVCVAILSISTTYGYGPFKHHTALDYPLDHINLNLNSARTTPYEETTENSFRQFPLNNLIKFDKKIRSRKPALVATRKRVKLRARIELQLHSNDE